MRSLRPTSAPPTSPKGLARTLILATGLFATSACPAENPNEATTGNSETAGQPTDNPTVGGPGCSGEEQIRLREDLPITINDKEAGVGEISLAAVPDEGEVFIPVGELQGKSGNGNGGIGNPDVNVITTNAVGASACDPDVNDLTTHTFAAEDVEGQTIILAASEVREAICDVNLSGGNGKSSAEVDVYTCPTEEDEMDTGTESSGGTETETETGGGDGDGDMETETSGDGDPATGDGDGDPSTGA